MSRRAYELRRLRACGRLQAWIRRRNARMLGARLREMWPTLKQLRTRYLDEDAVRAGALQSEHYSDEALIKREILRTHRVVVAALQHAWCASGGE